MRFKVTGKLILELILFFHVLLAIYDLRFLILPWGYITIKLWTLYTKPLGGQWVPAKIEKVRKMLEMADIKSGEVLYDLGSGDGRIVIEAARSHKVRAVGIEIDPVRVLISQIRLKMNNLEKNAEVRYGNIFNTSLKDADVVTMYLLPKTVNELKLKFKRELKSGSRIVSLQFPFTNWKPFRIDKENGIFVYKL